MLPPAASSPATAWYDGGQHVRDLHIRNDGYRRHGARSYRQQRGIHWPDGNGPQHGEQYRVRAALGGTFRVGPATVQSMYAPEFSAYSAGDVVRVVAAP